MSSCFVENIEKKKNVLHLKAIDLTVKVGGLCFIWHVAPNILYNNKILLNLDCDRLTISGQSGGTKNEGDEINIVCQTDCNPLPEIKLFRGIGQEKIVIEEITSSNRLEKSSYRLSKEDNMIPFYCDIEELSDVISAQIEYQISCK